MALGSLTEPKNRGQSTDSVKAGLGMGVLGMERADAWLVVVLAASLAGHHQGRLQLLFYYSLIPHKEIHANQDFTPDSLLPSNYTVASRENFHCTNKYNDTKSWQKITRE